MISGGTGNDTVYNYEGYVTVDGGSDDDFINSAGKFSAIYGKAGNDSFHISSNSDFSTIYGGEGKDTILNIGSQNIIMLGDEGDDHIDNWNN